MLWDTLKFTVKDCRKVSAHGHQAFDKIMYLSPVHTFKTIKTVKLFVGIFPIINEIFGTLISLCYRKFKMYCN